MSWGMWTGSVRHGLFCAWQFSSVRTTMYVSIRLPGGEPAECWMALFVRLDGWDCVWRELLLSRHPLLCLTAVAQTLSAWWEKTESWKSTLKISSSVGWRGWMFHKESLLHCYVLQKHLCKTHVCNNAVTYDLRRAEQALFSSQRPAILSPILFCRYTSNIFRAAGRKEEPAVSFSNQCVIQRPFYAFCFALLCWR